MSNTAQSIIDRVHAECSKTLAPEILQHPDAGGTRSFLDACATIGYESSRIVVLNGDLLVFDTIQKGYIENGHIWQAVDGFLSVGYTVESVVLLGAGTEPNPHKYRIVMTK